MNKTTEALKLMMEALEMQIHGAGSIIHSKLAWQAGHEALAEPVKLQFPTHLRKMWSGTEVQQWLDEQVQPVKRPQNCGTGYCSCIECPYEHVKQEPVCECRRKTEVVIESERLL